MSNKLIVQKIEKYLDYVVLSFIFLSITFLLMPEQVWPSHYTPGFFAVISLISAITLVLAKIIFKADDKMKNKAFIIIRIALAIALLLNILGELFFYQLYYYGFPYDKILHFMVPMIFLIALTLFQEFMYGISHRRATANATFLVIFGSAAWELIEYLSDYFFKTSQFGIYGKEKFPDTVLDLIFDVFGILIAGYILKDRKFYEKYIKKFWLE